MDKLDKIKIPLYQKKVYLINDYQKIRKNAYIHLYQKQFQNHNIHPIKPKIKRYLNTKIVEYKPKNKIKSLLAPVVIISMWFFAMCLFSQASYQFLQAICIQSVREITDLSK